MTRSRIVTALLLAGLGLLVWWFARNSYWADETITTPLRGEALRNPFYAAERFAEALGARTERRRIVGTLPHSDGVIVLAQWHWDLIEERREMLKRWVESGGRLLIDVSLIGGDDDLRTWAGIEQRFLIRINPPPGSITPTSGKRCSELHVETAASAEPGNARYRVCQIVSNAHLVSAKTTAWALSDDTGLQALRVRIRDGSLTVVNATPFLNQTLRDGDHARLFAAATQLRRGDRIYFFSDQGAESLLRLMWRYGAPVIGLAFLLVALGLWRGSARLGPLSAIPEPARRSLAEQIRGTGQFTLRFGGGKALHAAAVRALNEAALKRIARYGGLSNEERMAALATATRLDATSLSQAIHYTGSRRSSELRNTIALLESARRMILSSQER